MPADDDLLTASEAGAIVGVSAETIRVWARARRLRHVRLPSGQIRIHRADAENAVRVVEAEPGGATS